MAPEPDQRITAVVEREQGRLRNFIRRRVPDPRDVEDILQEVFYELVEANRLLMPIDRITAWLFRVARNRIVDLLRRTKSDRLGNSRASDYDDSHGDHMLAELLPSDEAGPEALFARRVMFEELDLALDALPAEQRAAFVGHEFEGRSFKEMAADTGVSVNTLLSRRRYAVLRLRKRLQRTYDDFTNRRGTRT